MTTARSLRMTSAPSGEPSGAGNPEPVLDDKAARALDHAGGERPAGGERLVVPHVLVVVAQVGDRLVDVGEVELAGPGLGAGLGSDGFQGGGAGWARPCRTRSSCPSAHSRAACGSPGCSAAAALPMYWLTWM